MKVHQQNTKQTLCVVNSGKMINPCGSLSSDIFLKPFCTIECIKALLVECWTYDQDVAGSNSTATLCCLFVWCLMTINPCGSLASDGIKLNMMWMEKVKICRIK